MDGFSVHAAGFLPKPVEQKQLWETLDFLAKALHQPPGGRL